MNRLLLLRRVYSTFLLSMFCVLHLHKVNRLQVSLKMVQVNL